MHPLAFLCTGLNYEKWKWLTDCLIHSLTNKCYSTEMKLTPKSRPKKYVLWIETE